MQVVELTGLLRDWNAVTRMIEIESGLAVFDPAAFTETGFLNDFDEMLTAFLTVGTARHPVATERLMKYWAHGEGAAKIRWPVPCAFCRCLTHAGKYYPKNPKGLCANLEKRATGHWPNPEHSRVHHCPC